VTRFRWGLASDVGRTRSANQDNALAIEGLFAVADGMGGHRGGEVASEVAIRALHGRSPIVTSDDLLDAIAIANDAILEQSTEDPNLRGMGTTLCVVALVDDEGEPRLAIANIGDSRVYLFSGGELAQMTDDHSLVATLMREGRLTPEEAEAHPQRNILTRALGIDHQVSIDAWYEQPLVGDRWVLCSDGLFNEVSDDQIASVLRRLADPAEAANELVRLANEAGGRDNITVLVVDVVEQPGPAELAAHPGGTERSGPAGARSGGDVDSMDDGIPSRTAAAPPARPATVRPRFTWRVALFVVALLVLAGAVVVAVAVFGTDDDVEPPPDRVTTTTTEPSTSAVPSTTVTTIAPTTTTPSPTTASTVAPG
jgi:PPM family protein phosphatase